MYKQSLASVEFVRLHIGNGFKKCIWPCFESVKQCIHCSTLGLFFTALHSHSHWHKNQSWLPWVKDQAIKEKNKSWYIFDKWNSSLYSQSYHDQSVGWGFFVCLIFCCLGSFLNKLQCYWQFQTFTSQVPRRPEGCLEYGPFWLCSETIKEERIGATTRASENLALWVCLWNSFESQRKISSLAPNLLCIWSK